jgi:hypothetical protein
MRVGPFNQRPQEDDPLQIAGEMALEAIKATLGYAGMDSDTYSVVITLEHGRHAATILHLPGDPSEEEYPERALEIQLLHASATAKGLGLELRVLPMMPGEG